MIMAPGLWPIQALAQEAIFDSPEFWAAHPSNFGAEAAWKDGARWKYGDKAVVAYHDGDLYGFALRMIPEDQDSHLQNRLEASYAQRAELLAIHAAGLFGFNELDCRAKANFESIAPSLKACETIELLGKMTGDWSGIGFSIAKFSGDGICSCRAALDNTEANRDCNIFFGPVARQEMSLLNRQGQGAELVEFFRKHHRKNIFGPDQFAMVIQALMDRGQKEDALVILSAAGQKFADSLDTAQWEAFGDYYLDLGQGDLAEKAFQKSIDTLYSDRRFVFEESCPKN